MRSNVLKCMGKNIARIESCVMEGCHHFGAHDKLPTNKCNKIRIIIIFHYYYFLNI